MKRAVFLLILELLLALVNVDTPPEVELIVSVMSLDFIEVLL